VKGNVKVKGKVIADSIVINSWVIKAPDYVFEDNYALPTLQQVESFVKQNRHLPDVPSARQMETQGVNVGEMNMVLLKKVEELTLYVLQQQKEIDALKAAMGNNR
jgi:hypothetical protein